jgi:hypothetical protein
MDAALNGPFGRTALGPAVLTIGRAGTNALVVNDVKASSRHAEISPTGSSYSITDVGSTNGTFVNEQRLDRNVPRMLTAGDKVRIGDTVFTYEGPTAFQQDATVYAGEANNPGYQPTVAAPPPYTNYDQGYVPTQQGQAWEPYQQVPPQPPAGYPPPAVYPSYTPQGQPGYVGTPAATTAPKMNRNLLIGLGAAGAVVVVLLIILFAVVLPSTPSKTLDAFCNALKAQDYQTAYNQFSTRVQALGSEASFASAAGQSQIASCTHNTPVESGNTATGSITFFSSAGQQSTGAVTLVKENGTWKIDNFPSS